MDYKLDESLSEKSQNDVYFDLIKDKEKFNEFPSIDHNPFMAGVVNSLKTKFKADGVVGTGRTTLVDENTGEVVESAHFFGKRKHVDEATFVKLFSARLREVFDLSKPAINVLFYIIDAIQKPMNVNRDIIYLDVQDIMEWCNYSSNSAVYIGLSELIKAGMIAKYEKRNFYWVDPSLVFNGDRVIIYEEYIKKEESYFNGKQKELGVPTVNTDNPGKSETRDRMLDE